MLSIVVVTMNRVHLLTPCVENVLEHTEGEFELIVWNNNSTDGTREYLDGLDDAPTMEFTDRRADIGSSDAQRAGQLLRVDRNRADVEHCVDLGHCAVDSPAGSHFPPVEDEFLLHWRKFHSFIPFCLYRNYSKYIGVSRGYLEKLKKIWEKVVRRDNMHAEKEGKGKLG